MADENGIPLHMGSSEGRIVYKSNGSTWFTETQVKDHLGSVRAVCSLNSTTRSRITRQVDAYYPFGMNIKELSQYSDAYLANEYMYNGKMMQDEMGLGWLDYGARFYDPVLARWHSVDPLAEKYRRWSPYNYCMDNPIRFIDPDGMVVDKYELNTETGEMKNVEKSENDVVYAVKTNEDGSTTRTGDKIEFEGKPITEARIVGMSEEGKPEQIIAVDNIKDGDNLFNFIKEQTGAKQEWSIIDYSQNESNPQSLITTSGLKDKEPTGSNIAQQLAATEGNTIIRFDHNHPERETSVQSSDGDRSVRDVVLTNNKDASVNIHFKQKNKWFSRSIKDDTKHHHSGEFN